MSLLLTIFGFSIACVGLIGLLKPRRLRDLLFTGDPHSRFRSAIMTRILVGGLFVGAAPSSHAPYILNAIGILMLMAAVGMYLLGRKRFQAVSDWWSDRPAMSVRAMSMVAVDVGLLLFHASS